MTALREAPQRVLVTGAHRRMAHALIEALLEDTRVAMVVAVDRGPCPVELLGRDPERFAYASVDLAKRRQVEHALLHEAVEGVGFSTVVHLCAESGSAGGAHRVHAHNVDATRYLLEGSVQHRVGKFVFVSSDSVYRLGPRADASVAEDAELDLSADAHPRVRDTIDAEFLCRAKMDQPDMEVCVLRPSGLIGDGLDSGLSQLLAGDPIYAPVGFDPLVQPLPLATFVRDVLLAILLRGGGVFNVGSPRVVSLSVLAQEQGRRVVRVPGAVIPLVYAAARRFGTTPFDVRVRPKRLFHSLVLDDRKFSARFRAHGELVFAEPAVVRAGAARD